MKSQQQYKVTELSVMQQLKNKIRKTSARGQSNAKTEISLSFLGKNAKRLLEERICPILPQMSNASRGVTNDPIFTLPPVVRRAKPRRLLSKSICQRNILPQHAPQNELRSGKRPLDLFLQTLMNTHRQCNKSLVSRTSVLRYVEQNRNECVLNPIYSETNQHTPVKKPIISLQKCERLTMRESSKENVDGLHVGLIRARRVKRIIKDADKREVENSPLKPWSINSSPSVHD